jgi:hypothetical protein
MITELMDVEAAVKANAEDIASSGTDIRPRLTKVVTQGAGESRPAGGLLAVVRAAADGVREGFARAVPDDPDDALRQVVDALGDGVSQTALAARLALEEAAGSSQQYRDEDLARLRDDLVAVRDLFAETVDRGLSAGQAFTAGQVAAARRHAERVAGRLGPAIGQALDAVRQHPLTFAREGVQAGLSAGKGATGSLFQAVGRTLQRAGEQLRQDGEPQPRPARP